MQYYLRFQCYDNSSRQTTTQLHEDIPVEEPPHFWYGKYVGIGHNDTDPMLWPVYRVNNVTHMQQIEDPHQPGKNAVLFQVFVVPQERWKEFDMPHQVRYILGQDDEELIGEKIG